MERAELAAQLIAAGDAERARLLAAHTALAGAGLAYALKDIAYAAWNTEPQRAVAAADALGALVSVTDDAEVAALHEWVSGIAAIVNGQMERAVSYLEAAEARFLALGKAHTAAATQTAKLLPLAVLGRYDEAIECGLRARDTYLEHDDRVAAGRIEQNIGNVYFRRDLYEEAERFQLLARSRFLELNDEQQLAKIDNSLAVIHSQQHRFRSAEQLYEQALERARRAHLVVTEAEIESGIGTFALFQGRYDRALDFLERARRKYADLGMPHESAVSELEIADAYLELNLAPESDAIYERVIPVFAELGMRAEEAQALARRGRASILLGQTERAAALLRQSRELFGAEGNRVGEAAVTLAEAQLALARGDYQIAERAALEAEGPLAEAGAIGRLLLARWLRGEAVRAAGRIAEAEELFRDTLALAGQHEQPQMAWRCHTSLGLLAARRGDASRAEEFFKLAVELIESLRAPLPAEEFRTAFFSDKLAPYDELVRLCLDDETQPRVAEALEFVERSRSRALVDMLGGSLKPAAPAPRDSFESGLSSELEELRQELNWFYSRINRPQEAEGVPGQDEMAALHAEVRTREAKTLEIMRQLQHHAPEMLPRVEPLNIERLQNDLGPASALVEYTTIDDELLAFVVTNEGVEVVRQLASAEEARRAVEQFRFQIDTLRYGVSRMRQHLPRLTARVRKHLQYLYDLLLAPVEEFLDERRLVVVPHRALHYVPFHALDDGAGYVIERREVSYAPSAVVLRHCLAKGERAFERALLVGVADEQVPRVLDEVRALAPLFPEALMLLDGSATLDALRERAPHVDVLHMACHGQFRPDNPLFSSLRLGDGWLTVGEAAKLQLRCGLVTLSACETGVSLVQPGDELIGLVRAFLAAGAPSLVLSLWTVDDEATARLMTTLYKALGAGERPSAALRQAQIEALQSEPHPYFWSPFALVGRW